MEKDYSLIAPIVTLDINASLVSQEENNQRQGHHYATGPAPTPRGLTRPSWRYLKWAKSPSPAVSPDCSQTSAAKGIRSIYSKKLTRPTLQQPVSIPEALPEKRSSSGPRRRSGLPQVMNRDTHHILPDQKHPEGAGRPRNDLNRIGIQPVNFTKKDI